MMTMPIAAFVLMLLAAFCVGICCTLAFAPRSPW